MFFLVFLAICAHSRRLYMISFDDSIRKMQKVEVNELTYDQFQNGCVHAFTYGGYMRYGEDLMKDFCSGFFIKEKRIEPEGKVSMKRIKWWVRSGELEDHFLVFSRQVFQQYISNKELPISVEDFETNFDHLGFDYPEFKTTGFDKEKIVWDAEHADFLEWPERHEAWMDEDIEYFDTPFDKEARKRAKHEDT